MGILDGQIRDSIYKGFKGKLLKGVLRRDELPESVGLDGKGDPLDSAPLPDIPIQGFTEQFSAFTRAQPGFPQTDLKLCIFGGSAPTLRPQGHDKVRLDRKGGSQWYRIRDGDGGVRVDPAGALWECQAYEIEAPAA